MDGISTALLLVSISFALLRTLSTKTLSAIRFGTRFYFTVQTVFFGTGTLLLAAVALFARACSSPVTLLFALGYAAALLSAQWGYTAALSRAGVSISSTVYSLAFVLPTVAGVLFFSEKTNFLGVIGIAIACATVVLSGIGKPSGGTDQKSRAVLPLYALMVAGSGGLGIMQKAWQTFPESGRETPILITLSFAIVTLIALMMHCLSRKEPVTATAPSKASLPAALGGFAFAACNVLNTELAGRVPGTLLFPLLNVSSILLTVGVVGIFLRERLRLREILLIVLAVASILCLSISRI